MAGQGGIYFIGNPSAGKGYIGQAGGYYPPIRMAQHLINGYGFPNFITEFGQGGISEEHSGQIIGGEDPFWSMRRTFTRDLRTVGACNLEYGFYEGRQNKINDKFELFNQDGSTGSDDKTQNLINFLENATITLANPAQRAYNNEWGGKKNFFYRRPQRVIRALEEQLHMNGIDIAIGPDDKPQVLENKSRTSIGKNGKKRVEGNLPGQVQTQSMDAAHQGTDAGNDSQGLHATRAIEYQLVKQFLTGNNNGQLGFGNKGLLIDILSHAEIGDAKTTNDAIIELRINLEKVKNILLPRITDDLKQLQHITLHNVENLHFDYFTLECSYDEQSINHTVDTILKSLTTKLTVRAFKKNGRGTIDKGELSRKITMLKIPAPAKGTVTLLPDKRPYPDWWPTIDELLPQLTHDAKILMKSTIAFNCSLWWKDDFANSRKTIGENINSNRNIFLQQNFDRFYKQLLAVLKIPEGQTAEERLEGNYLYQARLQEFNNQTEEKYVGRYVKTYLSHQQVETAIKAVLYVAGEEAVDNNISESALRTAEFDIG